MHLLNIVSSGDLGYTRCPVIPSSIDDVNHGDYSKSFIVNQYGKRVKKFGILRLRSLELLNSVLSQLYPSFGCLMVAQAHLNAEGQEVKVPEPEEKAIRLDRFVPQLIRR